MNELQYLKNAVSSLDIEGVSVHESYEHDRRKSIKKYFIQSGSMTISPSLCYNNMNHFILGMIKMKRIYEKTN